MMNRHIILSALLCAVALHARPADFGRILATIEKNNLQLKAARETGAASLQELRSENTPGTTSVEYSPFYGGGISGLATSELVITQEFDFPTLYASRRKAGRLGADVVELRYGMQRRDVLLEALQVCIDLHAADVQGRFLERRIGVSDTLLGIFADKLAHGEATQLDVNRIRMSRMNLQTSLLQNRADRSSFLLSLQRLNGGLPMDSLWGACPDGALVGFLSEGRGAPAVALESLEAEASLLQARQEVRVSRQGWLPGLTVGYRRNTDLGEAFNGFIVGASFPLFSTSGKVRAARRRQAAAELQARDADVERTAAFASLRDEAGRLEAMLHEYDEALMSQTLSLLEEAVRCGELPVSDYYVEADAVIVRMQERQDLDTRLFKVRAELMSNGL